MWPKAFAAARPNSGERCSVGTFLTEFRRLEGKAASSASRRASCFTSTQDCSEWQSARSPSKQYYRHFMVVYSQWIIGWLSCSSPLPHISTCRALNAFRSGYFSKAEPACFRALGRIVRYERCLEDVRPVSGCAPTVGAWAL